MSSLLADSRGLLVASAAAFGASILAVSEHAAQVELGYRLAAARREGQVLRREARTAERVAEGLREPAEVVRRGVAFGLGLDLPRDRRVLSADEVAALLSPPPATARAASGDADEVRAR